MPFPPQIQLAVVSPNIKRSSSHPRLLFLASPAGTATNIITAMEVTTTKRPLWTLLGLVLTLASTAQGVRISFLAIDPDGHEITDPQDCLQYFEDVDKRSRMTHKIVMGRPESNIDAIKVKMAFSGHDFLFLLSCHLGSRGFISFKRVKTCGHRCCVNRASQTF